MGAMMNTHGAFIYLGNGSAAFIDGIPDTCQHKHSDEVFQTSSGKMIYWHTYRQWAGFTSTMRNRLIYEHQEEIGDPIVMGTGQCRDCKKIDYPNPMDFDI